VLSSPTAGDYTGDGKADLALYEPTTADWLILDSSTGQACTQHFGAGTAIGGYDIPVPGNYDGTGKTEPAIYFPSTAEWFIDGPNGPRRVQFGAAGDIPVPADYDGDGVTDIAVYRPSTAQWFIDGSLFGPMVVQFGAPGLDQPVPGHYDGPGRAEPAVYRPTTGQWFVRPWSDGPYVQTFGVPGLDVPVPGQYDGSGRDEFAVYRPTTSEWSILGPAGPRVQPFGNPGDIPVPADYQGNGTAELAVYRPSTAQWIVLDPVAGPQTTAFGTPDLDVPLSSLTFSPLGAGQAWARTDPGWQALHQQDTARAAQADADVLFLGDSITYFWGDAGRPERGYPVWEKQVAPLRAENFGIISDGVENVLWRVLNGELAGNPKVVVLIVGINDLFVGESPDDVALGILNTLLAIHQQSPATKVLLLGLLPVGAPGSPIRMEVEQTNALIAHYGDGPAVRYVDAGASFLRADGSIDPILLPDGVHPGLLGYERLSAALQPTLQDLLGDPSAATVSALASSPGNYEGTGGADLTLFRPTTGDWLIAPSPATSSNLPRDVPFGAPGDIPVPADYDGDGKTDLAVFRPSNATWYILRSTAGPEVIQFGAAGDIPVPADYGGDGKADLAVYRASTATWYILNPVTGPEAVQFGTPGDIPVPADYAGDGHADIAVFRSSNATWYYHVDNARPLESLFPNGDYSQQFGAPGDIPVPGNYDGIDRAEFAVFRPSTAQWFVLGPPGTGLAWVAQFGAPGDIPVPADYDDDGLVDIGVYRPLTATWYLNQTTAGPDAITFGAPGLDVPVMAPPQERIALLAVPDTGPPDGPWPIPET
jgi:lysophospholipase L1-like esterase